MSRVDAYYILHKTQFVVLLELNGTKFITIGSNRFEYNRDIKSSGV